jgi:starvation-inducible outer membrane lipoprotein
MNLKCFITLIAMTACASLSGCADKRPFPPEVTEKVSPTFHFEAWRDASPSNPSGQSASGLRVELGGRIVQASKNGKGIVIVAEQLPIVTHPVYGPTEDVKRTGDFEFAFLYPGEIDSQDLRNGNRFIIVGTTTDRRPVLVNGAPKTEPFLIADCIHVWQTGRAEISEFKESVGGGYSPLPEKTYCAPKKK